MLKNSAPLPKLEQLHRIDRPLSVPEYYHACIGRSERTLALPREIVFVIEGRVTTEPIDWPAALDRVVAVNPGMRLRIVGQRQNARWVSDGPPPNFRKVEQCAWDGRSDHGADFIYETTLSLENGPTSELIVAGQGQVKIIFRALHAVMDGIGIMHVFQELFRALRGEPLVGTNAAFSDSALMRSVPAVPYKLKGFSAPTLTGHAHGNQRGGTWQRMTLAGPQMNLLPRIALAVAEFSRLHGEGLVRVAIPVNLRRHVPNLHSTSNFASMLYIDVKPADDIVSIKNRMNSMLKKNIETNHPKILEVIRYFPLGWLDRFVSRSAKNPASPAVFETAMLSVLGAFKPEVLSAPGFAAENLYGIPLLENTFVLVFGFKGRYEISVGMAHVFASDDRLEAFMKFLEERLTMGGGAYSLPPAPSAPSAHPRS